ncbi:MAG TPA: hypothetical protein VK933_09420 [Longimicrobiales bacterium]|nr:hypothetical protein [Longimicrobiales bacterium]
MAAGTVGVRAETAELLAFLSNPASYPGENDTVERIETHMAYVFLTDTFAWKLKKPVRYPFLDFSTEPLRRAVCEAEVRLNRRLAPDTYIGVVPVVRDAAGRLHIGDGATAPALDWLVKMKRLPRDRMLDHVIRAGGPTKADIAAVGDLLVRFYHAAPVEELTPDAYIRQLTANIREDICELADRADHLPFELIHGTGRALRKTMVRRADMFRARARARRIVEAHGDLRPEHVCLTHPPVIIDCLEFRRDFRLLDPVDELAFLGMECERLGAPWIGPALLTHYRDATGDHPPAALVDFYAAMRATLRAKLAIWHVRNGDPDAAGHWTAASHEYLVLAARHAGLPMTPTSAVRPATP